MKVRMIGLGTLMLAVAVPVLASDQVVQQKRGVSASPTEPSETRTKNDPRGKSAVRTSDDDVDGNTPTVRSVPTPRAGNDLDRPGRAFDAKFDEGMQAIRDRNPSKAVALMRPFLADFEKQYAGEKRQIYCAVTPEQSKRYLADAAKAQRDAVSIDPGWCRAQYVRGFALIDLKQYAEAQAAFEKLIALAPQHSRYLNELGYVFMQQKKWKESLAVYRRAEAAADLTPEKTIEERCMALKGMGYDLVELGDLNAAEAAYRQCLKLDPDDDDSEGQLDYIQEQRKQTV